MCCQPIKRVHQVSLLMIFILIYSVYDVSAQSVVKQPFVIFQPGEFFDPFTERSFGDHQSSASVTQQPNVLPRNTNSFAHAIWDLPDQGATNNYPRTIAQTSGNAAQIDAQIRRPGKVFAESSTFFVNKPKALDNHQIKTATNTPKALNIKRRGYARTTTPTSENIAHVSEQNYQLGATFAEPSNYFVNKPRNLDTQRKTVTNTHKTSNSVPRVYPRTRTRTRVNSTPVDSQIRQPSKTLAEPSTSFVNTPERLDDQLITITDTTEILNIAQPYNSITFAPTSESDIQVDKEPNKAFVGPSTFFVNNLETSDDQLQTVSTTPTSPLRSYPRTQTRGDSAKLNSQIRQPDRTVTKSFSSPNKNTKVSTDHVKTANRNLRTLRRLTAEAKKMTVLPRGSQTKNYQSSSLEDSEVRPTNLIAEASGHTNSLIGQSSELVEHPIHHAASKSNAAGRSHGSGYKKSHGDKDVEEYKSDHHKDIKDFKKHDDHHKKSHHNEKGGHHNEHHDEAGHYKKYNEGKKSHKAAKFGEKKGHKRGHKTKGYHNKFHRDEYHREHRFYDDYNKEGYHEKHGDQHSQYKKKQGGHKNGGSHKSGHNSKKHGKKGHSDKGNVEEEQKGFDKEGGQKKYHKHHKDYHKKQGNTKGNQYGYTKLQ